MTTTVTGLTTQVLLSHTYDNLTTTIGLAIIAVLAILLMVRELVPILREEGAPRETRALDMALVPLLIVFGIIVMARLAELLR